MKEQSFQGIGIQIIIIIKNITELVEISLKKSRCHYYHWTTVQHVCWQTIKITYIYNYNYNNHHCSISFHSCFLGDLLKTPITFQSFDSYCIPLKIFLSSMGFCIGRQGIVGVALSRMVFHVLWMSHGRNWNQPTKMKGPKQQ